MPALSTRLHSDHLCADELGIERWLTIFEQHLDDLFQVGVQLVEGLALAVRAGEARDVADVETGLGAAFNDGSVLMLGGGPGGGRCCLV